MAIGVGGGDYYDRSDYDSAFYGKYESCKSDNKKMVEDMAIIRKELNEVMMLVPLREIRATELNNMGNKIRAVTDKYL
jgi:hypothetical protein